MLKAKNNSDIEKIEAIVGGLSCVVYGDGINIDDFIPYDVLAKIVDYLRADEKKRRSRAQYLGMNSHIDKLWVAGDTIFFYGADETQAVEFIKSLGSLGYDVDTLLSEYKDKKRISI